MASDFGILSILRLDTNSLVCVLAVRASLKRITQKSRRILTLRHLNVLRLRFRSG